jgi:methionine synthase II (cobalamin-independent)
VSAGKDRNGRIPTSLVGSYAQPDWLIDRERLRGRLPPRVRATELWRVDPRHLEQAQDDATVLAIVDQERAGLDIITDGEMRRESYSNRFATALDGVDIDNPGTALDAPAARLVAAPDCGMKYLSRAAAYGKLEALVEGARLASQAAR